jgi:hypothetical protein
MKVEMTPKIFNVIECSLKLDRMALGVTIANLCASCTDRRQHAQQHNNVERYVSQEYKQHKHGEEAGFLINHCALGGQVLMSLFAAECVEQEAYKNEKIDKQDEERKTKYLCYQNNGKNIVWITKESLHSYYHANYVVELR